MTAASKGIEHPVLGAGAGVYDLKINKSRNLITEFGLKASRHPVWTKTGSGLDFRAL
jgi:hypothetical protein